MNECSMQSIAMVSIYNFNLKLVLLLLSILFTDLNQYFWYTALNKNFLLKYDFSIMKICLDVTGN